MLFKGPETRDREHRDLGRDRDLGCFDPIPEISAETEISVGQPWRHLFFFALWPEPIISSFPLHFAGAKLDHHCAWQRG